MKVPLARTKCGQKLSVLWQVDVGFDEETEAEQQVVKGGSLIRWKSIRGYSNIHDFHNSLGNRHLL